MCMISESDSTIEPPYHVLLDQNIVVVPLFFEHGERDGGAVVKIVEMGSWHRCIPMLIHRASDTMSLSYPFLNLEQQSLYSAKMINHHERPANANPFHREIL
jgi:hypothetical protein